MFIKNLAKYVIKISHIINFYKYLIHRITLIWANLIQTFTLSNN